MITLFSLLKWVVLFALVKAGIIEKSTVEKIAKGTIKLFKNIFLIVISTLFLFENQPLVHQQVYFERKFKEFSR